MNHVQIDRSFESWRAAARCLLNDGIQPEMVVWSDRVDDRLLPTFAAGDLTRRACQSLTRVPKKFIESARYAACHRDASRWSLLYRVLWRLTHGEPKLLEVVVDDDVHQLSSMHKAVSRDRHKMTAFVRFRRVERDGQESFIAWHRPDHYIVQLTAPFFRDRFATMNWTILTPDDSVTWDGHQLCFGPGVPASQAPPADALEDLWSTYYSSIFNPARINLKAMQKEMPKKHWATMPETRLITDLLRDAPRRVDEMVKRTAHVVPLEKCKNTGSAADFLPARLSLPQLREAATTCRGCDLYCNATQVVFGEGPRGATLMFVGEQPGDQEDLQGKPFVGPSGAILNDVLDQVGIDRDHDVYVTNAVKHFKFEQRGKRRIHSTPSARESAACRPWLEAEIKVVQPKIVVALGATAAKSLLGAGFRITKERGKFLGDTKWAPLVTATYHPSAILRQPDEQSRRRTLAEFTEDLRSVAEQLKR